MKALKIVLLVVAVLVLLLVGLAVWGYYAFLHTAPLTPEEVAELEVDWTPVTHGNWSPWVIAADGTQEWNPAKSFNDWLATVPEEEKAWGLLVELDHKHHDFLMNEDLDYFPVHMKQWARTVRALDTDEAGVLNTGILEGLSRPVMGAGLYNQSDPVEVAIAKGYGREWAINAAPVNPNEEVELINALLPGIAKLKGMTQYSLKYASRRLELGEPDAFIDSMGIVMSSGKLANEMPTLIGELVKIAIQNEVVESIDWAMDQHSGLFTDEQLGLLEGFFAPSDLFAVQTQGESLMFEDTIRRFADENGSINPLALRRKAKQAGTSKLGSATDLPIQQLDASAQRMIYIHQQVLKRDLGGVNDPDFGSGWSFYNSQRSELGKFEQVTLDILLPTFTKVNRVVKDNQRYANAVRVAIAARRHQLRHGTLPGVGETIDVDLLAGVDFMDPFTGKPLTYQRTEDGFRILPSHPEDEPDLVLWPKQYEPIVEDDEPEYYDWELDGMTEEQKEEVLGHP